MSLHVKDRGRAACIPADTIERFIERTTTPAKEEGLEDIEPWLGKPQRQKRARRTPSAA